MINRTRNAYPAYLFGAMVWAMKLWTVKKNMLMPNSPINSIT